VMGNQPMGEPRGSLRDRVNLAIREQGLDHNGIHPHSWRCENPDRFPGYCDCVASMADAIIAEMTESADLSPSDPASLLERGVDAPTQVQTDGGR
jgi:hypothetical protein